MKLKAFSKFDNTTEALAAATALVESKLSKGERSSSSAAAQQQLHTLAGQRTQSSAGNAARSRQRSSRCTSSGGGGGLQQNMSATAGSVQGSRSVAQNSARQQLKRTSRGRLALSTSVACGNQCCSLLSSGVGCLATGLTKVLKKHAVGDIACQPIPTKFVSLHIAFCLLRQA